jgi:probable O-glycosylation ligase (exosortase A-associated)
MKQTLLMLALTAIGAGGAIFIEPFYGVAIYYLFAVLRPQYMWEWSLPVLAWSWYVAMASILGAVGIGLGMLPFTRVLKPFPGFQLPHKALMVFAAWVMLTYFTAFSQDAAYFYFQEYQKIFIMFVVATLVVRTVQQIWVLYLLTALALGYIGYELNFLYLVDGRLDVYHRGYGGVDNNGAGLMLAVGVPLCVYAWEAAKPIWRWAFIAMVPILLHAIMMSYSRGAMLAMVFGVPLIILRTKRRKQFALMILVVGWMVPLMAGQEIRNEFFSSKDYNADESANSRFTSWNAAYRMANDNPFFGVGLRNSSLFSYSYGADMEGRVIHSQYLQILADNGYPGLLFYLILIFSSWRALWLTRRMIAPRSDPEADQIRAIVSGIECGLVVFLVAAAFLSVELFELPYVLLLMSAQLYAIVKRDLALTQEVPAPQEAAFASGRPSAAWAGHPTGPGPRGGGGGGGPRPYGGPYGPRPGPVRPEARPAGVNRGANAPPVPGHGPLPRRS